MNRDIISIVEVAYELESDDRAWLARVLEQAQPRLDRGFGVTISTYAPGVPPDESMADDRLPPRVREALLGWARANPATFQAINTPRGLGRCVTACQQLGMTSSLANTFGEFVQHFHSLGVRDFVGVMSLDPSGHAIWLGAPTGDTKRPSRQECAAWSRIAVHISAGARLRRKVAGLQGSDLAAGSDAVLSTSGAVEHAEPCAKSQSARDVLRRAALAIDRARSKARCNEDEALDLWKGLVAGHWSLVERFDHDGRRFLVAHKNEPHVQDPRALSLRERQILAYMAAGDSLKLTAYTLGLSPTSVFRHRESAMRKLALTCHSDVARLFFAAPPSSTSRK